MTDASCFISLLIGAGIGAFVALITAINFHHNTLEEFNLCQTACKNNGGIIKLFVNGDCDCASGASFSWQEINKE